MFLENGLLFSAFVDQNALYKWGETQFSTINAKDKYELKILKKVQTRRMSLFSQISVDMALRALGSQKINHIYFSSRHGEISHSADLLTLIKKNEILSPIKFSQSVHNTAAGLFTINAHLNVPAKSISGAEDNIETALFTTQSYLSTHDKHKVLLLISDQSIPNLYENSFSGFNESFAFAGVFSNEEKKGLNIQLKILPKKKSTQKPDQTSLTNYSKNKGDLLLKNLLKVLQENNDIRFQQNGLLRNWELNYYLN